MTIDKRTSEAVQREMALRSTDRAQRLNDMNERFDHLVKTGAVQPERYNIAPINPISLNSNFTFS
ncbi:hypothetical protein BK643_13990 [Pseudomonas protegens]|uniref:hypothetical protein n=1 Tax=Pseudomonas protegens TaxID=380021 RepID=UPI000F4A96AA|nr:hypothetical protein [Pseudomonas protegens]ROM16903.1 hypothetical protein BK643_13990 [Pseudomonas protegens]